MKNQRLGQARVLGTDELDLLISNLPEKHHQIAAEICRRTGCRIGEATQLTEVVWFFWTGPIVNL